VPITILNCPYCRANQAIELELNSGLGAPLRQCNKCGRGFKTGRQEWPSLALGERLRYLFFTMPYALLGGFLGAFGFAGAFHFWQHPGQSEMPLNEQTPAMVAGFLVWSALIISLQLYRLSRSETRYRDHASEPNRIPFWNFQTTLVLKIFLGM